MPIIEADYTLSSTARELEARVKDEHIAYLKERQRASDAERREADAERRASHWAALCVALLFAAVMLAAYALAT